MNAGDFSPVGCRICITSKAKIRYEGNLFSIDTENPDEPVITLSQVRSYGTENRPCERPVAARSQIYDQIVFRGKDLEDISIASSTVQTDDPSIISAPTPSKSNISSVFIPEADTSKEDNWPQDSNFVNNRRDKSPSALHNLTQGRDFATNATTNLSMFNAPGFSRNPSGGNRYDNAPDMNNRIRPHGDMRNEPESSAYNKRNESYRGGNDVGHTANNNSRMNYVGAISRTVENIPNNRTYDYGEHQVQRGWESKRGPVSNFSSRGHSNYGPAGSGIGGYDSNRQRRGISNNRGMPPSSGVYNRRGGRGGGWNRHTGVPTAGGENQPAFTDEYDYERANAELAAELEKITISGKVDADSSDVAEGSENSHSEDDPACYDKSKSFFDSISSEMLDRANGGKVVKQELKSVSQGMMNRRDERRLNSDTFGAAVRNMDRPRGRNYPYRGRGGGGGRGISGNSGGYGGFSYGSSGYHRGSGGINWRGYGGGGNMGSGSAYNRGSGQTNGTASIPKTASSHA